MIYDVAVIGAGITGAMTAYMLAKYNVSAVVVEAADDVATGTTKANSAIVHAGYDPVPGTLKAKLNVRGCSMTEEIATSLGVHYKKCGSHVVAFDDDDMATLHKLLERGIKNGVPDLKLLDRDALRAAVPAITPDAVGSLYAPTAGVVCPYDLAIACCQNAAANGVEFIFNFNVAEAYDLAGVWSLRTADGKSVEARFIVNAAGLRATEVAEIIGEHDFPVHITPRRGEYLLLDREAVVVDTVLFACPNANGKGILVATTADDNTICGPNAHEVSRIDDTETCAAGLEEVAAGARKLVPSVNLKAVITSFAGVRATPDTGDFYIARSKQLKNVIHTAGIESPGLVSAPAAAEYILTLLAEDGLPVVPRRNHIKTRTKDGNPRRFFDMTDDEREAAVAADPAFSRIICRCETVTEGDILNAIRIAPGAKSLDGVKRRVRAGMGRCQGGFCSPRVAELLSRELGVPLEHITKKGSGSELLYGDVK